ncbi:flavohemoprotein [Actinoplanes utahensis]|uniref:flavohemoprotein n=1 Tax=Actinoplanes utahensis TaxID=1869 RepID=UPI001F24DF94|nr:flavohemoprotein [Actinoplanes utahensis]
MRQNAPDAAAAGAADTAAALSEPAAGKDKAEETPPQAPPAVEPVNPPPYFSGRRPSDHDRVAAENARSAAQEPSLWRGDPGATLGRAGLQPRAAARGSVPPVGGITPSGPTTPVPNVPPVAAIRPPAAPGTDLPPPAAPPPPGAFLRGGGSARRGGLGSDGMDPADDAALLATQRLLSTSITFAGGVDEVAQRLWQALRQAQPELLTALPGDPEAQRAHLAAALTWLVHHMENPPALVSGCGRLGAVLAVCGVQWKQLQLVGAALAESLRAGMSPGNWRQDFDHAWRWTWQHTYEWIVHGGTLAAYQPTVWDAEVVAHERRRSDLAVIRVRPFLPMPFRPGQFARFEIPGMPGVWRPYSLAGAPHRDSLIELHVRAKSENGVSGALVHRVRRGHRLRLTGAEGDMGLPETPGRGVLMIAGDTGVAPMKAMLAELAATEDTRPAVLFWGVRDLDELYDIEDLTDLTARIPRATVVPVIAEGDSGPYLSGLVTDAVAAYGEWSRHEVYLAGPPLMLANTSASLLRLGIEPAQIHQTPRSSRMPGLRSGHGDPTSQNRRFVRSGPATNTQRPSRGPRARSAGLLPKRGRRAECGGRRYPSGLLVCGSRAVRHVRGGRVRGARLTADARPWRCRSARDGADQRVSVRRTALMRSAFSPAAPPGKPKRRRV